MIGTAKVSTNEYQFTRACAGLIGDFAIARCRLVIAIDVCINKLLNLGKNNALNFEQPGKTVFEFCYFCYIHFISVSFSNLDFLI